MRGTETDDGENVTPLSGVSVRATPVAGGSSQATATDAVGSFTFEKLPAGKYELILGLPANLSAAYTDTAILDEDQIPSVSIESRDADRRDAIFFISSRTGMTVKRPAVGAEGFVLDHYESMTPVLHPAALPGHL
jgi:hypothetical protein